MNKINLKGITWNHSRGITPLQAASQRFSELYPQVEITWQKRTLQEFADFPIEKLTEQYDLLIIDHPWVGCANATKCVVPLEQYLSTAYLKDQLNYSVGNSHMSYNYGSHQWALAIDAATQVASYRPDLLKRHGVPVPETWEDVLALAKMKKVAVASIPIDLLMCFYMFCIAHGKEPFLNEVEVIDNEIGLQAINTMKDLWSLLDKNMFTRNPIAVAELMSSTDDFWYCPFGYGYSNYSRTGYARHLLAYTDLVIFEPGKHLRSTIGGTGLAVSSFSQHIEWAIRFTEWVLSSQVQSSMYAQHGGQPGHCLAWVNKEINTLSNNFFSNTLTAMERGYTRPRYNGYLFFQDHAGIPLQKYLCHGGCPEIVLEEMNMLYKKSKQIIQP